MREEIACTRNEISEMKALLRQAIAARWWSTPSCLILLEDLMKNPYE